ncbi:Ig-like domain-containing protein [Anaerocolumna jejuensis]|uniref:Ig-like domain-containing protein n=1 Tax=Anaerocolumna jejuensis TaxID=259063 RepID=UPI003F7BAC47
MKKNFFKKKLASALALALVVASVSPSPLSASAATVAKIVDKGSSKATAVLYVDKVSYGKSAVNFDLSKTYAGTKYTWTISDSKKATIGAKTGYVVAKAPGVVTVKVTAKNKKGKTTKITQKVEIRKRATAVAAGDDFTLNSGETKTLKATVTPSNSTDAVRYYSSDEKIATVDAKTGVVTAVGAGEATITAYAKANAAAPNSSQWNVTDTVKVTVPVGIASVKQNSSTEVAATFNTKIASDKVKASDFSIVNDATKQVIAIKEVKADGTGVVKVTTFANMADGKTYNVTYNKKTVQFVATDGVVSSLSITPATVVYGKETEIKVNTVDAKGVVINSYAYGSAITDSKLEFNITDIKGYISGGTKLVLNNIGDTAKATATYHTWKYEGGQEVGAIKTELTITAVDKTAIGVEKYEYTISKNAPNWSNYTVNTQAAKGDQTTLWLRVKKTDDTYAVKGDYTFDSTNSNVLLVTNSGDNNLAASIRGVETGSAYVLVKDSKGTVIWSLAVTVVPEKSASYINLDKDSVQVSNYITKIVDTKVITATLKDQYNNEMSIAKDDLTIVSPSVSGSVNLPSVIASGSAITVKGAGLDGKEATPGTYNFIVKKGSTAQRNFTVTVVKPNPYASVSYDLDVNSTNFNTTVANKLPDVSQFIAKVAIKQGDAVIDYANITNYSIKKGTTEVASKAGVVGNLSDVTFDVVKVNGTTIEKKDAGSYTVDITYTGNDGKSYTMNKGFYVYDTQPELKAIQKETTVTASNDNDAIVKAFEFQYDGSKINVSSSDISEAKVTVLSGGNTHYIEYAKVYVNVTIDNVMYRVLVKADVKANVTY